MTSALAGVDLESARPRLVGLFDAAYYRTQAGLGAQDDAFAHYWAEGALLKPNCVFDPEFYIGRNRDAAAAPLLHYAEIGEPADKDPSALFDVAWYRRVYGAETPLAHYLSHRFGPFSPIPEFDAAFYLTAYPDVGAARLDPFLHYMHFGFREYRKPSATFNPKLYAARHMAGDRGANPLLHRRAQPLPPSPAAPADSFAEVRAFATAGPRFELLAAPPPGEPKALVIAFHLPQFHRIAENDAWWGEGFTEWTHLARGQPRFRGHYQPRIPGVLGFYDLSAAPALEAQARLARQAGIGAFAFYYYDFGVRRLLETPLELFLKTPSIDIGFCLMWANENWTRRWDGAEDEVLIAQDYDPAHEAARVADFARHMRDPRYLRLDGRPLLMVYRASLIPQTAETLARWRWLFETAHGEQPLFVMAQTFDDLDPRTLGCDAAIEFPPHKLTKGLPQIFDALDIFDDAFEADVFAYDDLVDASLSETASDYPLIKTAVPSWDNDARRQGRGLTLVGATPGKFERWLAELIARAPPVFGARIVAVNAWNEWCEGAYLEPDVHFGSAFLNATARAIRGPAPRPVARRGAAAFGASPPEGDDSETDVDVLFAKFWPKAAKVSVFVLHEGGPFPALRLDSLFAQTHPIFELVVFDVGEDSLDAVDEAARAADRDVTLGLGVADGLARAAEMARGDLVWIVGAHGRSDPGALAALAAPLRADPTLAFALCDSQPADAGGRPILRRPSPIETRRRPLAFTDRVLDGAQALGRLEDAPPISAVLWRREALARALTRCGRCGVAGGVALLRAAADGARAAYVAERLDFTPSAGQAASDDA